MKTRKEYYRIVKLKSRDLNPVITKELYYFDSGNYQTDKIQAKKYSKGKTLIFLSKRKYNTFGEIINNN